jgi:hypothetical protein
MLTDWELWACAHRYVREHDFDAPVFVALRLDELLEAGDLDGVATYRMILKYTHDLLAKPKDASALH